jgi:hypothetical protein
MAQDNTMRATIIAVAALLATGPAFAGTSLLPHLAEADHLLNEPPIYACNEDKTDCYLMRFGVNHATGEGYEIRDHPNGVRVTCYYPGQKAIGSNYALCGDGKSFWPVNGTALHKLPTDDPRCKGFGSVDTLEYLICLSGQSQK